MQLVFPLHPVADNPRIVMRRTTKVERPLGYGAVVDPNGAHEEVRVSGACYTTLSQWVREDSIARVDDRSRLPPAWVLGLMHGAHSLDMCDPVTSLGFQKIWLGAAAATSYRDLLGVINTCSPTPAIYFALGLSPFRMGGHIIGFKVTENGGDYLDPADGLYRATSRAALFWGVDEKIKRYVDLMLSSCPTLDVELWAIEPE